jgi:hypothetical protein
MKVLHCPICGRVREGVPRQRQVCSKTCAAKLHKQRYGADFHHQAGKKAGAASAIVTKRKTEALWRSRWPGVPIAVAREIYVRGYNAGHQIGSRVAYAKGWSAAIREVA